MSASFGKSIEDREFLVTYLLAILLCGERLFLVNGGGSVGTGMRLIGVRFMYDCF